MIARALTANSTTAAINYGLCIATSPEVLRATELSRFKLTHGERLEAATKKNLIRSSRPDPSSYRLLFSLWFLASPVVWLEEAGTGLISFAGYCSWNAD